MLVRADKHEPWTASEVAEAVGGSRRTAFDRLHELLELGAVESKKVGSNARIWWIPESERE